jgi:hypothetical protein
LTGAGLGAVTGAIIGSATGDAGAGAAIGAGLGTVTGGVIGAGMDETERRTQAQIAAATAVPPPPTVTIDDVIQMTRRGVHEDTIISTIHSNHCVFHLQPAQVMYLTEQGVSPRVINAMQQTASRPHPVVVRPGPVVREVYVERAPPVVFGFGYHHHRPRHWHHRHCW